MRRFCLLLCLAVLHLSPAYADHGSPTGCECGHEPANFSIDQLLACHAKPSCKADRLGIKIALQFKGRSLVDALKSYMRLSNNSLLSEKERETYTHLAEDGKERLRAISKITPFEINEELLEPLYIDFDYPDRDYHRYYASFNLGFEYVSLDNLGDSGFPRMGVSVYRRYGETPARKEGWGNYGVHARISLQLTSSAEQLTGTEQKNAELSNTLDATGELFLPRFHSIISLDHTLSDFMGPIVAYSAKKVSGQDRVTNRLYGGIRSAVNPETFMDVLMGYTQGVHNSRLEIRAQLPMYKFSHGSRIFFGTTVNMNPPWEELTEEQDFVRFYLDWNADFERIVSGLTAAVGI
ncbi:MAG: hypothetical protein OEZ47_11880 [Gammaproteobacteria bacterium]|nr:hypothetical protein [Gammaproteobacteria bacterium]